MTRDRESPTPRERQISAYRKSLEQISRTCGSIFLLVWESSESTSSKKHHTQLTLPLFLTPNMATALRFSNATLRPVLSSVRSPVKTAAFNGLRCYSSAKTQVSSMPMRLYERADWFSDTERVICGEAPR